MERIEVRMYGMSSEKTREKRVRRKSKVSWGRLIRSGLVEPKVRLKSVIDGQLVNIPTPVQRILTQEVTQEVWTSGRLDVAV